MVTSRSLCKEMVVDQHCKRWVLQPCWPGRYAVERIVVDLESPFSLKLIDNFLREAAGESECHEICRADSLQVREIPSIIIGVGIDSSHGEECLVNFAPGVYSRCHTSQQCKRT